MRRCVWANVSYWSRVFNTVHEPLTDHHCTLFSTHTIWIQYGLLNTRVNAAAGRSFAQKVRVRFYAGPWEICGGQCGKGPVWSPITSFLTYQHNCTATRAGSVSADHLNISTTVLCCKLQSIPHVHHDTWKDSLLSCGKKHSLILIVVQRDATQSSLFIILQVHSTCFGRQPHPSSEAHKTVTTASGTGHIFCAATSLQLGQVGGR